MKFTTVFVALAASIASASAFSHDTNALRLARGLSPLPPMRRATPVSAARRNQPSGSPPPEGGIQNSCNTGPVQCCDTVTHATPGITLIIETLLGLVVPADVAVGLTCHPLSILGGGHNTCRQQPVCCENNEFNGVVAIGCSPININVN